MRLTGTRPRGRKMVDLPPSDEPGVVDIVEDGGTSGDQPEPREIRRILVALDASSNSRAALATAIGVAEALKTEIHGLFIEDINLLRLADLPFAREVLFAEAQLRSLQRDELQRRLRARAAILRREIADLANEHKITSTFQVIRGPVDRELLSAALDSDLLVLGRLGHSISRRMQLGSTARAIVSRASSAVLLVKSGVETGPIIALYDASAAGNRVLELAAELASHTGDLKVLVWAPDESQAFDYRQLAAQVLEKSTARIQFQHLSGDNPRLILEWINRQKASLLLMVGRESALPADIFQTLLDEAEQHILVLR